jgi:hypothetical protein
MNKNDIKLIASVVVILGGFVYLTVDLIKAIRFTKKADAYFLRLNAAHENYQKYYESITGTPTAAQLERLNELRDALIDV